ncbi:hypothetical protein ACFLV3_03555 [Chloroflexota bacterium]
MSTTIKKAIDGFLLNCKVEGKSWGTTTSLLYYFFCSPYMFISYSYDFYSQNHSTVVLSKQTLSFILLSMSRVLGRIQETINTWRIRDRAFDKHAKVISKFLWPWRESKLVIFVYSVAFLDFASTYALLDLSGNKYVYEGGPLASWALARGGFPMLFFIDFIAASLLILIAAIGRLGYYKFGFEGFGRAAFTVTLVPYMVVTMAVIFNNVALTFI